MEVGLVFLYSRQVLIGSSPLEVLLFFTSFILLLVHFVLFLPLVYSLLLPASRLLPLLFLALLHCVELCELKRKLELELDWLLSSIRVASKVSIGSGVFEAMEIARDVTNTAE